MKIDIRPRHRNAPRIAEKSAPAFLQWLRGRECFFAYMGGCEGKMEAMHLDFAGDKGIATKVRDSAAIPSCAGHHRLQHNKGWGTFLLMTGHSREGLLHAAGRFWMLWPGRLAWERKLEQ